MSATIQHLAHLLLQHEGKSGDDAPTIYSGDTAVGISDLVEKMRRVAGAYGQLGMVPGYRVALLLPDTPFTICCQYAAHLIGAILVPIAVNRSVETVRHILQASGARVLITTPELSERLHENPDSEPLLSQILTAESVDMASGRLPEWAESATMYRETPVGDGNSPAVLYFTAGVTGPPRGAALTHRNLLYTMGAIDRELRLRKKDRFYCGIPLLHPIGNLLELLLGLSAGADLLLPNGETGPADAATLESLEPTILAGLPAFYNSLLTGDGSGELPTMRMALLGGGGLSSARVELFSQRFKAKLVTVYGSCETSTVTSLSPAHREETPPQSIGRALAGSLVRIVDSEGKEAKTGTPGRIAVKGPGLFAGYWQEGQVHSAVSGSDGWFLTDDTGYEDLDGWLFLLGRQQDQVEKAGFTVHPAAVEEVLLTHPSVQHCGVFGIPDSRVGSEIAAYVEPNPGMIVLEDELRAHCAEHLPQYKIPKHILTIEKVPLSPDGEVLRGKLREIWSGNHA